MAMDDRIRLLEQRLAILEDKDELSTLMNHYCTLVDSKQYTEWSNLFTEDGILHFEPWGPVRGRENIARVTSDAEKAYDCMMHCLTNVQFEVDGSDTAKGSAYITSYVTPHLKNLGINFALGGRYSLLFKRTAEGWKVAEHLLSPTWTQGSDASGKLNSSE
ncbi:hypothetical protein CBS147371_10603 [Aspergillus niger]|nr:hypothetical protein CBS147371_10603 [Aspergillus niger]